MKNQVSVFVFVLYLSTVRASVISVLYGFYIADALRLPSTRNLNYWNLNRLQWAGA